MTLQHESNDTVICPYCLSANSDRDHFCRKCGTPLTSNAVIDPLGQIYSEGDTYRKAIAAPTKPIVLIGMWLLFGPAAFGSLIMLLWSVYSVMTQPFGPIDVKSVFGAVIFFVMIGGLGVISSIIVFRVTRNFMRQRQVSAETED